MIGGFLIFPSTPVDDKFTSASPYRSSQSIPPRVSSSYVAILAQPLLWDSKYPRRFVSRHPTYMVCWDSPNMFLLGGR